MLSPADALTAQALAQPDRLALGCGEQRVTFGELERRANAAARMLRALGVRPGDRVATLLPNGITMVELLFAAARAGAILCPLNTRLQAEEVAFQLRDAGPRLLVARAALLAGVAGAVPHGLPVVLDAERSGGAPGYAELRSAEDGGPFSSIAGEDDPWLLVYTSGTTGRPKGALRTQRRDYLVGLALASAVGVGAGDAGLALLPMFHVNSIWFATLSLSVGASCHIYPHAQFHPVRMAEELERSGATYAMFVPTMLGYLADMLESGRVRLPALRLVLTSSAALPPVLRDRLLQALPGTGFVDIYGATELGPATLAVHRPGAPAGSIGFPVPGARVRLLDAERRPVAPGEVGELFVDSPFLMDGYFARAEETEAAFAGAYLSVGDLARQASDGRLYLVDRKADVVITSGENVYPVEVENVLAAHPAVAAAAVVGVPDDRRGEAVAAVVALRPGTRAGALELAAHCRASLADYKCPRAFAFAEALPLGPTGKVNRRQIREAWRAGVYRDAAG